MVWMVYDLPGDDFVVVETTFGSQTFASYPESADVFITNNGVDFYFVGSALTKEQASFDIADAGVPGLEYITAVKIVDTTPEGSVSDDGYDVDGIIAISGCSPQPDNTPGDCFATELVEYIQGTTSNDGTLPAIRTNPSQALGAPEGTDSYVFTTLGYGGSITLGFGGAVVNGPGADFAVVETSFGNAGCAAYKEYADVYVSTDGVDFHFAKTVCKSDNLVDISDAGAFTHIHYVKVVNNNDLTFTPDGYDLDGIIVLDCGGDEVDEDGDDSDGFVHLESQDILTSYPNPTNGPSQALFVTATTDRAVLEVYDMNGRSVATLFNALAEQGVEYRIDFDGTSLPNGIYIYRLTTGSESIVQKFMITR